MSWRAAKNSPRSPRLKPIKIPKLHDQNEKDTQKDGKKSDDKECSQFSFSSPWHFSDVILEVEEQKFHVHKSTLSMWSKVFETMFTADFKEKSSHEIPLPGKKATDIKILLTLIYDREASVNDQNLEILLKLGDEYQMEKVITLCTNYMKNTVLRKATAMHVYALARRFNLTPIFKKKCMAHIEQWPTALINNNGHFTEFSLKEQLEMMTARSHCLEDALLDPDIRRKRLKEDLNEKKLIASCSVCQSSPTSVDYSYICFDLNSGGKTINMIDYSDED